MHGKAHSEQGITGIGGGTELLGSDRAMFGGSRQFLGPVCNKCRLFCSDTCDCVVGSKIVFRLTGVGSSGRVEAVSQVLISCEEGTRSICSSFPPFRMLSPKYRPVA